MLNHAPVIPDQLAEMHMLHEFAPEISEEFKQENWIWIKKNPRVTFCAVGGENVLEHINWSKKKNVWHLIWNYIKPQRTHQTPSHCTRATKGSRATEAKQIASTSSKIPTYRRTLATAGRPIQEKNVEELIISIQRSTIPFLGDRCDLFDLATKIVMPKEVKRDMC